MTTRSRRSFSSASHAALRANRNDQEPSLCDLLADPILKMLMRRDGVEKRTLDAIVVDARRRLGLLRKPKRDGDTPMTVVRHTRFKSDKLR